MPSAADIHKIRHNDTLLLRGGMTHRVTPPGYALSYCGSSATCPTTLWHAHVVPEHTWVAEPGPCTGERKEP